MANEKRARQKAMREERLQAEMATEKRTKRNKQVIRWIVIIGGTLIAFFVYGLLFSNNDNTSDEAETDCPAEDMSSERTASFEGKPPSCIVADIAAEKLFVAEFETSEGSFEAVLDPAVSPITVNNFIFLSRYHAYDETIFHQVLDGDQVVGGDVQNGFGIGTTPGFLFTGTFADQEQYRVGTILMSPNRHGSVFHILSGQAGLERQTPFSPVGQIIRGIDVLLEIQSVDTENRAAANDQTAANVPVEDIILHSVTISEASEADIEAYQSAMGD